MLKLPIKDVEKLIPQGKPFVFVSELIEYSTDHCQTRFHHPDNELQDWMILENMAQSMALHRGYGESIDESAQPKQGFIAAIRNAEFQSFSHLSHESLITQIEITMRHSGFTTAKATSSLENEIIATATIITAINSQN